jgi:hypothetical protein
MIVLTAPLGTERSRRKARLRRSRSRLRCLPGEIALAPPFRSGYGARKPRGNDVGLRGGGEYDRWVRRGAGGHCSVKV